MVWLFFISSENELSKPYSNRFFNQFFDKFNAFHALFIVMARGLFERSVSQSKKTELKYCVTK